MKRPKKARKQASKTESLKLVHDGHHWRATYGWGTGTAFHDPLLAAARALKRRLQKAKPFVPNVNIPHYGEWYGGHQEHSDPVREHQEMLLESA